MAAVVVLLAALVLGPEPARPAPAGAVTEHCAASGPATPSGSALITGPMVPQITGSPLDVPVAVTGTATDRINPAGVVTTTATVEVDLAAIAADVLEQRVKPGVAGAGYPQLVPTAWVELDLAPLALSFPLPPGTTALGTPVAQGTGAHADFAGDGVRLTVDSLHADTRSPDGPATVTLTWQARDGGAPAPRSLAWTVGDASFTASVSVGLLFYGAPVKGTVAAPWSCTPAEAHTMATTDVTDEPVTTVPVTTVPSSSASTGTTGTTGPTTSTRPSATTTPPSACPAPALDRFGGATVDALDATGFFRTARIGGRWWLVDPDGHPFFSQGINHITFQGTPDRNGVSAYRDAATARYGTEQAWADAQAARMDQWGYNTVGAWSDGTMQAEQRPYTVLLDLTSQDFGTGRMQDLWDPGWVTSVEASVQSQAVPRRDDPFLVGYWLDNELHWGPDWRPLHLFDEYLAMPAAAPGKQALLAWLQARYPTFADFAGDFTTSATDWASLADPTTATSFTSGGGAATRSAWMGEVAERYFSVTGDALKAADPNHLNLGPRFITQTTGTPVLEAAARHVDVVSFNFYEIVPELAAPLEHADPTYLPTDDGLAAQAALVGKPILISEWSYRAADSGLPNTWPPLFPVLDTQAQRAAAYEHYASTLLANPAVVGQHWFEHADEPPAGRFDGEDSNFGLVDLHDDPYPQLVAISRTMYDCAYARLLEAPATTTTTAGPTTGPPTTAPATGSTATTSSTGGAPTTSPATTAAVPVTAEARFTG